MTNSFWGNTENCVSYRIINPDILIVSSKEERQVYYLEETNKKEIVKRRIKNLPTFVLKEGERFFYTEVFNLQRMSTNVLPKRHQCYDCAHCKATTEKMGGCSKVRDCDVKTYCSDGNSLKEAVRLSKRIEKYPFILYGYETFGLEEKTDEIFCVEVCSHYEPSKREGCMTFARMKEIKQLMEKVKDFYE